MFKRILVAFDGTDEAYSAFMYALEMADKLKAELEVISVIIVPQPALESETRDALERGQEKYEKYFTHFKQNAKEHGVDIKTEIVMGTPSDQILLRAEKYKVDLIILGHWPKSGIKSWFTGTISSRVIDKAHCSVLIVKENRYKLPKL